MTSCNPELQEAGKSETDVVKYFKIAKTDDPRSLGEGFLIAVHVGEKRILSYYIKNANGFSHTDVTLKPGDIASYVVDSVYSQTPNCRLFPSFEQPNYLQQIRIEEEVKLLNLEEVSVEEAMSVQKTLACP